HVRLVVVAPVADIFAALRREQIERIPGLLQTGAQPPLGRSAGCARNGLEGPLDDLRLLAGRSFVEAARVALVMPHPLPAALVTLLDDDRMVLAKVAVERDRAADAVAVEHLHQAPHADAVAVVAVGPHHHIGGLAAGAVAPGALLQRGELDVGDDPECETLAFRPRQAWTIDDGRIVERAVVARFHLSWPCAP